MVKKISIKNVKEGEIIKVSKFEDRFMDCWGYPETNLPIYWKYEIQSRGGFQKVGIVEMQKNGVVKQIHKDRNNRLNIQIYICN